jgi:hypothetical protein
MSAKQADDSRALSAVGVWSARRRELFMIRPRDGPMLMTMDRLSAGLRTVIWRQTKAPAWLRSAIGLRWMHLQAAL